MSAVATNKLDQLAAKLAGLGQTKDSPKAADAKQDFQKSSVWVNVGKHTDEGFITLPLNLPIEHMKPKDVSSKNADYVVKATLQNVLLATLQEMGKELKPGASLEIPLVVQLYRSEDTTAVANSADVNERVTKAMAQISFA